MSVFVCFFRHHGDHSVHAGVEVVDVCLKAKSADPSSDRPLTCSSLSCRPHCHHGSSHDQPCPAGHKFGGPGPCTYPACTLHVPCMHPACTLHVPCACPACTLHVPCTYPARTLHVPCMYPARTLHVSLDAPSSKTTARIGKQASELGMRSRDEIDARE